MATYKVVDADKLDADLTSVAEKIRNSCGSVGKMVFPDGYKKGIDDVYSFAYESGNSTGYFTGHEEGYSIGYSEGNQAGYDDGYEEGTKSSIPEDLDSVLTEQEALIDELKTVLQGKASGGGSTEPDPRDQYQRVEYIESAEEGTYPYIITDFYADNDSGVEVIASFAVMQDRIPMGSRLDSGSTRFYCAYPLSTTSCYYGFNIGSSISCSTKVNTKYRLQTNFMNSRQAIIYEANGTRKAFATFSQTLSEHTAPVSIFGYNSASGGTVTSKREYRLYSARLSHGFDIVREYIPCYRKSDGVVGVYEKFTGQFLTTEVGAFAKGADVEWGE